MVAPTIKTSNIAQTGRGRRLNVCEANFTLSEAKQFDRPVAERSLTQSLSFQERWMRMQTERSIGSTTKRDPSVVGEPLPRLFSPDTVEKRFDAAAIVSVSPYLTNISPLRSG